MHTDLLIQRPVAQPDAVQAPDELLLLCHGVGSSAEDLRPLGLALAAMRPGAWVVSLAAALPGVAVHLLHGEQDRVMPVALAIDAHRQLQALGMPTTLERFEGLGHGIDGRMLRAIEAHLAAIAATAA